MGSFLNTTYDMDLESAAVLGVNSEHLDKRRKLYDLLCASCGKRIGAHKYSDFITCFGFMGKQYNTVPPDAPAANLNA